MIKLMDCLQPGQKPEDFEDYSVLDAYFDSLVEEEKFAYTTDFSREIGVLDSLRNRINYDIQEGPDHSNINPKSHYHIALRDLSRMPVFCPTFIPMIEVKKDLKERNLEEKTKEINGWGYTGEIRGPILTTTDEDVLTHIINHQQKGIYTDSVRQMSLDIFGDDGGREYKKIHESLNALIATSIKFKTAKTRGNFSLVSGYVEDTETKKIKISLHESLIAMLESKEIHYINSTVRNSLQTQPQKALHRFLSGQQKQGCMASLDVLASVTGIAEGQPKNKRRNKVKTALTTMAKSNIATATFFKNGTVSCALIKQKAV